MPSAIVGPLKASLTADGRANGEVDVANAEEWVPGMRVNCTDNNTTAFEAVVVRIVGTNTIQLRKLDAKSRFGHSSMTDLTLAQGAKISAPRQTVPVNAAFVPRTRM